MRKVAALMRASWLEASSYRMRMAMSLLGILFNVIPVYYMASAVQPMVASSITNEGANYFAFIVVGLVVLPFVRSSIGALPGELSGAISSGTLEAMVGTPTRLATLLTGMVAYPFLWAGVRSGVMLTLAYAFGVHLIWAQLPFALATLALIVFAHAAVGLIGGALILAFRTAGPLENIVLFGSTMLGGLFVPTQVIPSWLADVSRALPLTYGLRAFRRALLEPATSWSTLLPDLLTLLAIGAGMCVAGAIALVAALRYAQRAGTLAQY